MKFQEWISISKELLDTIKQLPPNFVQSTKMYNSKHFSFLYDPITTSCTYKMGVLYDDPVQNMLGQIAGSHPHTHHHSFNTTSPNSPTYINTGGNITITAPTSYASTETRKLVGQVSVTILDGEVLDAKFISKSENGFTISQTSFTGTAAFSEDGGKLLYSTLFISDSIIMVNGKIYDIENSPEAFNEDLVNEEGVSILDLAALREYYGRRTTE